MANFEPCPFSVQQLAALTPYEYQQVATPKYLFASPMAHSTPAFSCNGGYLNTNPDR